MRYIFFFFFFFSPLFPRFVLPPGKNSRNQRTFLWPRETWAIVTQRELTNDDSESLKTNGKSAMHLHCFLRRRSITTIDLFISKGRLPCSSRKTYFLRASSARYSYINESKGSREHRYIISRRSFALPYCELPWKFNTLWEKR